MEYAICNETFQGWDWAKTCHYVAHLGYQGIEVAPFTLNPDIRSLTSHARRMMAQTAHRAGLNVVGLHWLLVSPRGLSLTSADDAIRRNTSDYLVSLVDFCADMTGKTLVLGSPAQRRIPEGSTVDEAVDRLIGCLEPALNRCEKHSINLCIEPLPRPDADLILTLKQAVDVIERMQHPALKTILDVKSASSEDEQIPALIHRYAHLIAHVHANDVNLRGPGFGDVDFQPILKALSDIHYTGPVSIEVFDYTPDAETIARESLAYLKRSEPSG